MLEISDLYTKYRKLALTYISDLSMNFSKCAKGNGERKT